MLIPPSSFSRFPPPIFLSPFWLLSDQISPSKCNDHAKCTRMECNRMEGGGGRAVELAFGLIRNYYSPFHFCSFFGHYNPPLFIFATSFIQKWPQPHPPFVHLQRMFAILADCCAQFVAIWFIHSIHSIIPQIIFRHWASIMEWMLGQFNNISLPILLFPFSNGCKVGIQFLIKNNKNL